MNLDVYEMLRAREVAQHAHTGQVDKSGQDYYRAHVADVAHRVGLDLRLRTVAYLHDVAEDTDFSIGVLVVLFSEDIVAAVDALTRRHREHPDDYYARVKANPLALQVKLADIASNTDPNRMALLDEPTRERLTRKYEHALKMLR